jgi:hypothetical protein
MEARIYQPTRNAMQSGEANSHYWALEFLPDNAPFIDPLMGWSGGTDTTQQVKLYFGTKEEAIAYAEKNAIDYEISDPAPKLKVIKPKSYASNFAFNRIA